MTTDMEEIHVPKDKSINGMLSFFNGISIVVGYLMTNES